MKDEVEVKKSEHSYIIKRIKYSTTHQDQELSKIHTLFSKVVIKEISVGQYLKGVLDYFYKTKRNSWRKKLEELKK